jgi:hypothetical protein
MSTLKTNSTSGCGLVGAVRRPKYRDRWLRGFVCAVATNYLNHMDPVATRDLLGTAGKTEKILKHADPEDIETLQSAGFLSPNRPIV